MLYAECPGSSWLREERTKRRRRRSAVVAECQGPEARIAACTCVQEIGSRACRDSAANFLFFFFVLVVD